MRQSIVITDASSGIGALTEVRANGRPTAQWSCLAAGRCDDLFAAGRN